MIKLFDKRNVLKNLFICITMVLVLTVTGCTSSAAKKAMEETRLAVSNGEYQEALTYAKLAVKEGVKDEKFLSLFQVLTDYQSAEDALSNNDPDKAQSILNEIKDLGRVLGGCLHTFSTKLTNLKDLLRKHSH